jgi:hypothetical protein
MMGISLSGVNSMHAAIKPDFVDGDLPMIKHWCIIFSFKVRFTPVL